MLELELPLYTRFAVYVWSYLQTIYLYLKTIPGFLRAWWAVAIDRGRTKQIAPGTVNASCK